MMGITIKLNIMFFIGEVRGARRIRSYFEYQFSVNAIQA